MSRIVFREKFRALLAFVSKPFAILTKLATEGRFLINFINYSYQKYTKTSYLMVKWYKIFIKVRNKMNMLIIISL